MDEVVNPNDMQVSQLERVPRLALQVIQRRRIGQHQVREKLERNLAFQLFIARQPDNAHSAAPKNFDQRVTAEKFLPASMLTQCRFRDITRALLSHVPSVVRIRSRTKLK